VLSWLNPRKPGYVYPEIMGYYASLCAERGRSPGGEAWLERGARVARAIVDSLSRDGGLGRAGIDYAFDTGIALSGLLRLQRVAGGSEHRDAMLRMGAFLANSLERRVAAWKDGRPHVDLDSWSLSFGASALKAAMAMELAAEHFRDEAARELVRRTVRELVQGSFRDGAFHINAHRDWVYAHAHCYALEALLVLAPRGLADPAPIAPGAAWLAEVQNADGSLTNWHGRTDLPLGHQGDATSQAVRIWSAVDRARYAGNVARALAFLASLQTLEGGLRYDHASEDVNSWVSMFAAQAVAWSRDGAEPEWVL
jgi:hypothetical protein